MNLTAVLGSSNAKPKVYESTLTFNQIGSAVDNLSAVPLCDNTLSSFYIPNVWDSHNDVQMSETLIMGVILLP